MKDNLDKDILEIFKKDLRLRIELKELGFKIMPHVIETLLLSGKIEKSRTDDIDYVWSIIMQNLDVIDEIEYSFRIDDQLMESAREAAKLKRIPVVVILVATIIEHLLNIFYRDTLSKRFDLSAEEVTEIIRSNIHTKLSWLLKIVDGNISVGLQKQIKKIIELRNSFVHYKSVGVLINKKDQIQQAIEQANDMGLEVILNTPAELEDELSTVVTEIFPEYEIAKKITQAMIESKLKKRSKEHS